MANESRVFRIPNDFQVQTLAQALASFLGTSKSMETRVIPTTDGFVVQGRQEKDGWKTISGMRLATTVQLMNMGSMLNVTIGQGEWSDKIGAGALGWFIAWPLAVTAGIGVYQQKKLPEEIFHMIESYLMTGGHQVQIQGAGQMVAPGKRVCPVCQAQVDEDMRFCTQCGASLSRNCECGAALNPGVRFCPQCGKPVNP